MTGSGYGARPLVEYRHGRKLTRGDRARSELEAVSDRCLLVSGPAQEMPFPDGSFDVIVSNLCLHNIYDMPTWQRALNQIVPVLAAGGTAIISDYKRSESMQQPFAKRA